MTDNQNTLRLRHVIDQPTDAGTFAQSNFHQLINQVRLLTQAVLVTQGQNQVVALQQVSTPPITLTPLITHRHKKTTIERCF